MSTVFHYEIDWPAASHYPGHHKSAHAGSGLEFTGYAPLLTAADARRIDLRASLKDPLGRWLVRTYRERSAIALYVLADLSASMGVIGTLRKLDVLADFTASAAQSAYRTGDAFGFIGSDERPRQDFLLPATRARGAGVALSMCLRAFTPTGISAEGLRQAHSWLPRRRSLVFLVSDFHFSRSLLESVLDSLTRYYVVPVVLWDRVELAPATGSFRISVVRDAETERQRLLLFRPGFKKRLTFGFRQRYESLCDVFEHRGLRPLLLTEGFRAEWVTQHFVSTQPARLPPEW